MKIWLDDLRKPPKGYVMARSVNEAKKIIEAAEYNGENINVIDCDHDLGDFASDGGDGIYLLDWLIERDTLYHIELHTANPVGRSNTKRMLDRFWKDEN